MSIKERIKKILPKKTVQGIYYLRKYGAAAFFRRIAKGEDLDRPQPAGEISYEQWRTCMAPTEAQLEQQRQTRFSGGPKISIAVPLFRTPETFLRQMIDSVLCQTYENWELCLANGDPSDEKVNAVLEEYQNADSRILVKDLAENLGISGNTNEAISMASGDFIGLLDHDDLLDPSACFEAASRIVNDPEIDVLYTDEDKVSMDTSHYFEPHFKPDFNLDLLRGNNYICHFFLVRKSLLDQVGGFRKEFDGSQDYDLILRCTEAAKKICHIPKALYHWRMHLQSTAQNPESKMYCFDAGKRAIEAHLARTGTKGTVSYTENLGFYRVTYPVEGSPLVSVLIPNKDEKKTLETCINSILERSTYENYEIIIIENNSETEEIFAYYKELEQNPRIRVVTWNGTGFHYSDLNNFGFSYAKGDYVILLNNDTEVISKDWIEELLGHCQRPEVGIVGAKLYYPDDTVQHGGVIIGRGGLAGHAFTGLPRGEVGYFRKASMQSDLSAVTAACMMVKSSVYKQAGGFDPQIAVAFNDVDFCLRVRQLGLLVVYDPYVELYHYESKSRKTEDTPEKQRRFQSEVEYVSSRWKKYLPDRDPYYNPNWSQSLDRPCYTLKECQDGSDEQALPK